MLVNRNPWQVVGRQVKKHIKKWALPIGYDAALRYASRNSNVGDPVTFAGRSKLVKRFRGPSRQIAPRVVKVVDMPRKSGYRRTNASRGTSEGMSGGFVKTKRRRYSKTSQRRTNGVNYTAEFGGTYADTNMVVVGHSTTPGEKLMRMVWLSVLKKLLLGAGFVNEVEDFASVNLFNDDGTGSAEPNSVDLLTVYYQTRIGQSVTDDSRELGLVGASVIDVADWLMDTARPWNTVGETNGDNFHFYEISFKPHGIVPGFTSAPQHPKRYYSLMLENLVIMCDVKSSFKMQNRTVNTEGEDATAVDNVPLYGKSYEGSGTGAWWKDQQLHQGSGFVANHLNGVFMTTRPANMLEPPKSEEFRGVTKVGKIHLQPGQIKTSVLNYKASHTIKQWVKLLEPLRFLAYPLSKTGKYRFFCIEKIMDPEGTSSIVCGYEHNLAITTSVKSYRPKPTTVQIFESTRNITPVAA